MLTNYKLSKQIFYFFIHICRGDTTHTYHQKYYKEWESSGYFHGKWFDYKFL